MTKRNSLWEILVPTHDNENKKWSVNWHQEWDNKVRAIAGGLTIFKPSKGQWIADDASVFKESMIPVRVFCTDEEIKQIALMTLTHYIQIEVMYYQISEKAFIIKA